MKTVCIVQARSASSRLPHKVLAPIAGRPLIHHVLDRAAAIVGIDELVVTIPHGDVALLHVLEAYGVRVYFGPEHDVLRRFVLAAEATSADVVVRVTGDCPLLAPEAGTHVLDSIVAECDYAWNDTRTSGWPDGMDVEAFTVELLLEADRQSLDREHVTPWIRRQARHIGTILRGPNALSLTKFSVDTFADLQQVRRVAAYLRPGQYSFLDTLDAKRVADIRYTEVRIDA